MTDMEMKALAIDALKLSYVPYSKYHVGACLLAVDGRTFQGANFENASYGATICAERCAVSNAIAHGVGVEMLSIKKLSDHLTEIHANIYCERAAHKSIIIGKQGAMLGTIGSEARRDIEKLLGTKVMLKLWVKVRENWRNRAEDLENLGYTEQ